MIEAPLTLDSKAAPAAWRWLPLFIGIAVGIRIALVLMIGPHAAGRAGSLWFPDSADYDQLARNMLEHQPYEVGGNLASRMPGYPLFVAAVYAVCGYSTQAVLIVQALMGGGIVALTYAIARRGGVAIGLLAALLAAFDPLSIGFSVTLLSETSFTFLLMLALWRVIRILEGGPVPDGHSFTIGNAAALQIHAQRGSFGLTDRSRSFFAFGIRECLDGAGTDLGRSRLHEGVRFMVPRPAGGIRGRGSARFVQTPAAGRTGNCHRHRLFDPRPLADPQLPTFWQRTVATDHAGRHFVV